MIDTSNAKWEFSKEEKYVIQWFNDNGYDGRIIKQYVGKTLFEISKEGVIDKFELSQGITLKNLEGCMEQYKKNWELFCELQKLRKEVKS